MIPAGLRPVLSRLAFMVGGEALQSGFHFGLNIVLLKSLSAVHYGVFALTMVMGGLGLTYIRALTAMPAAICIGQSRSGRTADAHEITFGTGAVLICALTMAASAIILDIWVETGVVAGTLFIGLWALRSHLRTAFFARGRQRIVNLSDLAFAASGTVLAGLAVVHGVDILKMALAALALANAIGIAVMLLLARRPVRLSLGRSMRRRYAGMRSQLSWSFVSVTTTNLQGQGMAFLVAGLAGPAAYAPIAAALVMFVPLRIAATALANMMQPELSAMLARGEAGKVRRQAMTWVGLMGLAGLLYGSVVVLVLPLVRIDALAGTPVYLVAVLAWAFYTLTMMSVMPRILLEIFAAFRTITITSAACAALGAAVMVPVLLAGHPAWALFGGVLSEGTVLIVASVIGLRRLDAIEGAHAQPVRFDRAAAQRQGWLQPGAGQAGSPLK